MGKHDTRITRKGRSSADYAVGYKRPPAATRFQPGKSGNPNGRPKGDEAAIEDAIFKVMDEPFVMTEGGKRRRMPAMEAIFRGLRTKAMNGDVRAAEFLVAFLIEQEEKHLSPAQRLEDLTRQRLHIIGQMNEQDRTNHLAEMSNEELQAILRYGGPAPKPLDRSDQ